MTGSEAIAREILGRMERDFFHHTDDERNVAKLLRDCRFEEVDLNDDATPEIIAKLNWFSDGRVGISKGHNYLRGAQDQGVYHVYAVTEGRVRFLGSIEGNWWRPLRSRSEGYLEIRTGAHAAADKEFVRRYSCRHGRYELVELAHHTYYEPDEYGQWQLVRVIPFDPETWRPIPPTDVPPAP